MRDEAPFDLGVVGDEEAAPPAVERGRAGRWVWTLVALAFVLGGVLALVVANARDDAAAYADVRLASGLLAMSLHAEESRPGSAELSVLNLGEHEVEILGLEPAGTTIRADHQPEEPVVAPPGEWVTASQTGLIADCSVSDPGDGVLIRVRDGGGTERVVEADPLPQYAGVSAGWAAVCRSTEMPVQVNDASVVARNAESLSMDLPIFNSGAAAVQVAEFVPVSPGLVAAAPEVPFEIPGGVVVAAPLTWTVTDCEAALQWPDVEITYEVSGVPGDSGDESRLTAGHWLTGRARAELVLLVQRVCGDGG